MAIADFIHSCGLPFSLASHHKFKRVLELAKNAPKKYKPPGRNLVAGKLLDMNYQLYKDKMMEKLQVDWAKKLTYSRNMYILTYLKAR